MIFSRRGILGLFVLTAVLTSCADDEQIKVLRGSEIIRVCADGAVILQYQGRLYRNYGGFPKAFTESTALSETCSQPKDTP